MMCRIISLAKYEIDWPKDCSPKTITLTIYLGFISYYHVHYIPIIFSMQPTGRSYYDYMVNKSKKIIGIQFYEIIAL